MNYYIIVDKIKSSHESGVYGRRELSKEEKKNLELPNIFDIFTDDEKSLTDKSLSILKLGFTPFPTIVNHLINKYKDGSSSEISLQKRFDDNKRVLIFQNSLLDKNYNLNEKDLEYFYGYFDSNKVTFEKIIRSYGGSTLTVVERDLINKKHFGGESGVFSTGLYCEHPKNNEILIPLNNSIEIVKNMILEEIISSYEALGAKKIKIIDLYEAEQNVKINAKMVKASEDAHFSQYILREKEYGKGTFNPERAMFNKMFIHDFPNVMTTINARIYGNQILDKFTEIIDLSGGIEIDILNLYSANLNFNYKRKWQFEVQFYDKND